MPSAPATKVLSRHEAYAFIAACLLGLWLALSMPVFAQEAYYWSYAQRPDLSYFDHPPMVAWLIWIGTHVFGDGPLGLRFCTWACSCLTTWIALVWLRDLGGSPRVRIGLVVCSLAVPLLAASHFLTTPDPPLCMFWTLSMFALWRARDGGVGWWLLSGFAAGCALLSKYTAVFLAVGGVVVLLLDPQMRRQWRRPGLYLGVLTAIVTFLPVIAWNVGNDFESFRFQTAGRFGKAELDGHLLPGYAVGQVGVFHPVLAVALPVALTWLWRRAWRRDRSAIWVLAFGAPLPLFFTACALFLQVKINWLLPAYVPLLCGLLLWWQERESAVREGWPRLCSVAQGAVLVSAIVFPLLAPLIRLVPRLGGTSWGGWEQIAQRARYWEANLDREDGVAGNVFFCTPNYRDAAQLMREIKLADEAAAPAARQHDGSVLAQNVFGEPALQFDHWDAPAKHLGEDAIFVVSRPDRYHDLNGRLAAHFRAVGPPERVRVERYGIVIAEADIYRCSHYLGPRPQR